MKRRFLKSFLPDPAEFWIKESTSEARGAGLFASIAMAFAGVFVGAFCVYLGGQGAQVSAQRFDQSAAPKLRRATLSGPAAAFEQRARYVEQIIEETLSPAVRAGSEQRLRPPVMIKDKPRIIIVFDDMGLDKKAFERVMALPGPVTMAFLPYADDVQTMADRARKRGDAVMLHLPMQPIGKQDPGPVSLNVNMSGVELLTAIAHNLSQFHGYIGVNNHMGSAFTADPAGMKTLLSILKNRGFFFLDSLTTASSVAVQTGREINTTVFSRDVFLDPDLDRATVFKQLAVVERIARETGYAVAICHPRADTIDVIGPWLTTAPARGFELATVQTLLDVENALRSKDRAKPALKS